MYAAMAQQQSMGPQGQQYGAPAHAPVSNNAEGMLGGIEQMLNQQIQLTGGSVGTIPVDFNHMAKSYTPYEIQQAQSQGAFIQVTFYWTDNCLTCANLRNKVIPELIEGQKHRAGAFINSRATLTTDRDLPITNFVEVHITAENASRLLPINPVTNIQYTTVDLPIVEFTVIDKDGNDLGIAPHTQHQFTWSTEVDPNTGAPLPLNQQEANARASNPTRVVTNAVVLPSLYTYTPMYRYVSMFDSFYETFLRGVNLYPTTMLDFIFGGKPRGFAK
jgi:hypothetical protein